MNWRVIGCATVGIGAFLAIGILGLMLVLGSTGCPRRVPWGTVSYLPEGTPAPEPSLAEGRPVRIGSIFVGLTTRELYAPPGSDPVPSDSAAAPGGEQPAALVLECGDGTYQAYRAAP